MRCEPSPVRKRGSWLAEDQRKAVSIDAVDAVRGCPWTESLACIGTIYYLDPVPRETPFPAFGSIIPLFEEISYASDIVRITSSNEAQYSCRKGSRKVDWAQSLVIVKWRQEDAQRGIRFVAWHFCVGTYANQHTMCLHSCNSYAQIITVWVVSMRTYFAWTMGNLVNVPRLDSSGPSWLLPPLGTSSLLLLVGCGLHKYADSREVCLLLAMLATAKRLYFDLLCCSVLVDWLTAGLSKAHRS